MKKQRRKSSRKPYDLRARVRTTEIKMGALHLRGPWERQDRRDVVMTIHPEDVPLVERALLALKNADAEFSAARETRKQAAAREKLARLARRKAVKERMFEGVALIDED